ALTGTPSRTIETGPIGALHEETIMRTSLSERMRLVPAAGLLFLFSAVGCRGGLYPVHGKVTYPDGTPLAKGLVGFESATGTPSITARGDIRADGSYELSTFKPGDGAPAGKYRVLVSPRDYENIDGLDGPRRGPAFDKRYMDFSTSGLVFEVKAGSNEFP